jgi:hypothetical protein
MEINRSYFISTEYIKASYPSISNNIDDDIIESSINFAQSINFMNVLGQNLFEKTMTGLYSGDTVYTKYCIDVVEYFTLYHLMDELNERIRPTGISVETPENSQRVDNYIFKAKQKKYLSMAETAASKLTKYICANINTYNDYVTNSNEKTKPNLNSSFGFDLSKTNPKGW